MRKKLTIVILTLAFLFIIDGVFGVSSFYADNFGGWYLDKDEIELVSETVESEEYVYLVDMVAFNRGVNEGIKSGIHVQDIPAEEMNSKELILDEHRHVFYMDGGIKRKVIFNRSQIYYLIFSPSKDKFGFFYGQAKPGIGEDVSLVIMNIRDRKVTEVYTGSFRTSFWKWVDDDTVRVYYNTGTGVRHYRDIDVDIVESFVTFVNRSSSGFWVQEVPTETGAWVLSSDLE